jgi:glycosyltransferase involved in cell wall biosynthesis
MLKSGPIFKISDRPDWSRKKVFRSLSGPKDRDQGRQPAGNFPSANTQSKMPFPMLLSASERSGHQPIGSWFCLRGQPKLRIGIDGDALRAPLSGVGRYVFNLSRELDALLPDALFIAYSRLPAAALHLPSPNWQLRTEPVIAFRRLPSFVWLKTRCRAMCASDRVDVFWAGRTLHPSLAGDVRTVCTVHDLNYLVVPETMQFQSRWSSRLWFRRDILKADCVLANSCGTAERLRTMVGAQVSEVVPPGVTPQFHPPRPTSEVEISENLFRLGVKQPYLLSVATQEPRKNVDLLLRAYIDLKRAGVLSEHRLVLAGPAGWKNKSLQQRLREANAHGLVLAGYVPDESMPMLYAGADALVFPSSYEGFGMPVLEARACGARVVTTDIPELREAGDEYVIYVEPTLDGIKAGIVRAISSPKPPSRVRQTWKDSARILARALCGGGSAHSTRQEAFVSAASE